MSRYETIILSDDETIRLSDYISDHVPMRLSRHETVTLSDYQTIRLSDYAPEITLN